MHFRTLYLIENTSIDELTELFASSVEDEIECDFMYKYCNCCGEEEPSVRDVCDCCGYVGNVIPALGGIKSKWDETGVGFNIVNIRDIADEFLNNIESKFCDIAIWNHTEDTYVERNDYEFDDYIRRIKNRDIRGVITIFSCKS